MRRLGRHKIVPMPVANEERGAGVVPEGPATGQEVEPSVAGGPTVEGLLEAPSSLELSKSEYYHELLSNLDVNTSH